MNKKNALFFALPLFLSFGCQPRRPTDTNSTIFSNHETQQRNRFEERIHENWIQGFTVDRILLEKKFGLQELVIFENKEFGRVMALDGVIQLAEADEFIYHEMLTHVPLLAHGNAKKILVIGGGDGGILREVLRHPTVESVVHVEIDQSVIELSKEWLPNISKGAFDDPRVQIVLADGAKYVQETQDRFDVVICDSTDPIGLGETLYSPEFFANCKRILNPKGIFVNQNGVPFIQGSEVTDTYKSIKDHFAVKTFYLAPVPTYTGGHMTFAWATDCTEYSNLSEEVLEQRMRKIKGEMRYYTPAVHHAAFALPRYIQELFANS